MVGRIDSIFALEIKNYKLNLKFRVNMTNLISLAIVICSFLSLLVVVAYVADALAVRLVKWLGLEDVSYE